MESTLPTLERPVSQPVSTSQFVESAFKRWALTELQWQFGFNRKLWEYVYILRVLEVYGMLRGRGLGFGVGADPIVPVMLRCGARLVVTDLAPEKARLHGWAPMTFGSSPEMQVQNVDMNSIPTSLREFDFVWSCGSLEHIGGHAAGLDFIKRAMACLKPGGIAVHTTELMYGDTEHHFDSPNLSIYCGKDVQTLAESMKAMGHHMEVNLQFGTHILDGFVSDDRDPWELKIRERVGSHIITSMGLVVQAGGRPLGP